MTAANIDLAFEQGATKTWRARVGTLLVDVDGVPILDSNGNKQIDVGRDFSNCTARAQVRLKKDKVNSDGTVESYPALLTVTTEDTDGGITLDDQGNVVVVFPDESTDALIYPKGYWDLKIYNQDGTEERLFEGAVTVDTAVTKDV